MNRVYISFLLLVIFTGCTLTPLTRSENFESIPPGNQTQAYGKNQSSVSFTPFPTPASTGEKSVNLAWFYKPPENGSLSELSENFDFFILTHRDETERDQLRTLGVDAVMYQYLLFVQIMDPGSCTERPFGNQVAYKPGDFCQISTEHPDWFLRGKNGEIIRKDSNVYMDPGNEEYRRFWLERAQEMQTQFGWEGVFIDNVEASLDKIKRLGTTPSAYDDETSYQNEIEEFLKFLHESYFKPQNIPVLANIIELNDNDVWFRYIQYLDGAMVEAFSTGYNNRHLPITEWKGQMDLATQTQAIGKIVILVAQGEQDDLRKQEFALGSYLLVNNGRAVFRYTNSDEYENIWLYDNYSTKLGLPLGEAYSTGLSWRRDFENGHIIVDPISYTAKITLND